MLNLPSAQLSHVIEKNGDNYTITVSSAKLAKNVFLQTDALGHFSDNYFDLLPGESRKITFTPKKGRLEDGFALKSLRDTYHGK